MQHFSLNCHKAVNFGKSVCLSGPFLLTKRHFCNIIELIKMKGDSCMDIIQRTMLLMSRLIQRIKNIGNLLSYSNQPADEEDQKGFGLFWIFNW